MRPVIDRRFNPDSQNPFLPIRKLGQSMIQKGLMLLMLLLGASGCRSMDSAAKPIVLPPASIITAIEVRPNHGQERAAVAITDRESIGRFVEFVNSRPDGWKQPWDTFPSGMYTVTVKRDDEIIAVFWPSTGHIGGRDGGQGAESNRLRPLSEDEWNEFRAIIGVNSTQPLP
jgi:hypothetical protein